MGSIPAQKASKRFSNHDPSVKNNDSCIPEPTPVFLFAHGSTMMLGEESEPARIWEDIGNDCLRRGVKRIVMMVCISISKKKEVYGQY